jgi:hypothetical protein
MPRCLKVLELVVAVVAGLTAAGWYSAACGVNAEECDWGWTVACWAVALVFQVYAQCKAFDALIGDDGLLCDLGDVFHRRSEFATTVEQRKLPVGRRGLRWRNPSLTLRRRGARFGIRR